MNSVAEVPSCESLVEGRFYAMSAAGADGDVASKEIRRL
jgi:hypothetical protein